MNKMLLTVIFKSGVVQFYRILEDGNAEDAFLRIHNVMLKGLLVSFDTHKGYATILTSEIASFSVEEDKENEYENN